MTRFCSLQSSKEVGGEKLTELDFLASLLQINKMYAHQRPCKMKIGHLFSCGFSDRVNIQVVFHDTELINTKARVLIKKKSIETQFMVVYTKAHNKFYIVIIVSITQRK